MLHCDGKMWQFFNIREELSLLKEVLIDRCNNNYQINRLRSEHIAFKEHHPQGNTTRKHLRD